MLCWTSFMYRKIEIYSKFNDDISYHFQVFVDTYFEQAFTRLCFFRSIEKYMWNLYVANSQDPNSNKNMWQLSEFNAGWCMLQKWHQSTTDKNYSFSFISIRPIYSIWGVYLLPYWEDGGLSQPHNDMRDACRPLKNVGSWRSRDAWNWNVL